MDDVNDAELVERALAADASARESLILRHARRIRALCWSRLPPHGPIEDSVQETFLRAFRLLPRLERRASFGSFAAGIAIRVCADWRKAAARTEVPLESDCAAEVEPDDVAGSDRLHAAIRALPEAYRDVIALFYFADRSYREIAVALGLTESAVNARLAKARSLLKETLAGGAE